MLCFRDRCYCPFWGECAKGVTCDRALTPLIEKAAEKADLLICVFIDKPECYEEME